MINLFDPTDDPKNVAEMIISYLNSDPTYIFRKHVLNQYTWQSILKKKIIPLLEETGLSTND